jgi:hypothetical protein
MRDVVDNLQMVVTELGNIEGTDDHRKMKCRDIPDVWSVISGMVGNIPTKSCRDIPDMETSTEGRV